MSRRSARLKDKPVIDTGDDIDLSKVTEDSNNKDKDITSDDMVKAGTCGVGMDRQDQKSVLLLMFLYVLQGVPLGLAGSIPYLLSSRHVSYKDQAMFSFVFWPFSLKLLWAPIVDAVYIRRLGRRKSWLVPTQYLIGAFMILLSGHVTAMMGDDVEGAKVDIFMLTVVFFFLNFLAATQDIAVDGWALTMLSRENVGWASTCNSVGQTAGYFLGNILFLALESPVFCNTYLRSVPQEGGIVTFQNFMWFWGIIFFITTTLVLIFKSDKERQLGPAGEDEQPEQKLLEKIDPYAEQTVPEAYGTLWRICGLSSVRQLCLVLLTVKIGFAAADNVTVLKLIEYGIPRETLAVFSVPLIPIQIALPLLISRYTNGPKPLDVFIKAIPFRLIMGLWLMFMVVWAPMVIGTDGEIPPYYYLTLLGSYALHQVALYSMYVAQMSFFAQVSDPLIGGTYMTLLNTITNLGGNWPGTIALWFVDGLTWKTCEGGQGSCGSPELVELCKTTGGSCVTTLDGFYLESVICFMFGFGWLYMRGKHTIKLQELPASSWSCQRYFPV